MRLKLIAMRKGLNAADAELRPECTVSSSTTSFSLNNRPVAARPRDEYERLFANLEPVRLPKNRILYEPEESMRYVHILSTGMAALLAINEEGQSTGQTTRHFICRTYAARFRASGFQCKRKRFSEVAHSLRYRLNERLIGNRELLSHFLKILDGVVIEPDCKLSLKSLGVGVLHRF